MAESGCARERVAISTPASLQFPGPRPSRTDGPWYRLRRGSRSESGERARDPIRERLHARFAETLETEAVDTEGFEVAAVVDLRCCGDLDAGPQPDGALVATGSTIGATPMGRAPPSSSIRPNRGFSAPRVALPQLRRRQHAISGT